jgi:hypothetical protein
MSFTVSVTFSSDQRIPAAKMPGEGYTLAIIPADSSHNHGIGITNAFLEHSYSGNMRDLRNGRSYLMKTKIFVKNNFQYFSRLTIQL